MKPWNERYELSTTHSYAGTPCWEFTGSKTNGYGWVWICGKMKAFHRAMHEKYNEPITSDKPFVLHHCDNRACGNPAHLFAGTHQDNMRDRAKKGRNKGGGGDQRGSKNSKAKLTEEQVLEIRKLEGIIPRQQVAEKFNVSNSIIYRIWQGKTWSHI